MFVIFCLCFSCSNKDKIFAVDCPNIFIYDVIPWLLTSSCSSPVNPEICNDHANITTKDFILVIMINFWFYMSQFFT